jgi:hypothetical protein
MLKNNPTDLPPLKIQSGQGLIWHLFISKSEGLLLRQFIFNPYTEEKISFNSFM